MQDLGTPECNSACAYTIIMLYAFHTQRHIKSKLINHSKSIYLIDIFDLIIPQLILSGLALGLKAN